jgi:hypothetical protein
MADLMSHPASTDSKIKINFGQLSETDIHEDRLDIHNKENGSWMFDITEEGQAGSLIYSFEEIKETLRYLDLDLTKTDWYEKVSADSRSIVSAKREPTSFHPPEDYLTEVSDDHLKDNLQLLPARVNGVKECMICGEGTYTDQESYCLFGLSPIQFHEYCFYNFIAAIQDILDGVEPVMVSKSI